MRHCASLSLKGGLTQERTEVTCEVTMADDAVASETVPNAGGIGVVIFSTITNV